MEDAPPPGDLPDPGSKPTSFMSPALAGGFFTTSTTYEALSIIAYSLQPIVSVTKVDTGVEGRGVYMCHRRPVTQEKVTNKKRW